MNGRNLPKYCVFLGLVAASCGGQEHVDEFSRAMLRQKTFALLAVTVEASPIDGSALPDAAALAGDPGEATRTPVARITAQFVRHRVSETYDASHRKQLARWLALPTRSIDLPEVDQCELSGILATDFSEQHDGDVELIEAGRLSVSVGGAAFTLVPRHFPGLLPFISGAVYHEQHALTGDLGHVVANARGSSSVGAFFVQAAQPEPPANVQVDARSSHGPIILRWLPATIPQSTDKTYITLRFPLEEQAVRCHVRDDGKFAIRSDLLRRLSPELSAWADLSVQVGRLREVSFGADGLDQGTLLISTLALPRQVGAFTSRR